jgi:hypothetical protein
VLLVFVRGLMLAVRRAPVREPLYWPLLSLIPLLVAAAGLFRQSFLAIGDIRWPSVLVAVGTGLLLATVAAAALHTAVRLWRTRPTFDRRLVLDGLLLTGALQWLMTLGYWGLLPLRLWA